jgi:hypothetical protein
MQEIVIVDAIMGSGKTYDAIEKMKKSTNSFIYVTPFLGEVNRVIKEMPDVEQPVVSQKFISKEEGYRPIHKRANLLGLANSGVNIATTHSLFNSLSKSDYSLFSNYDLILDEVIDPIETISISADDIKIAIEQKLILIGNDGEVKYTGESYNGVFKKIKKYCDTSNVYLIENRLLVWAFPPEIFKAFKSIKVLTYMFEGSLLSSYFEFYNIKYQHKKNTSSEKKVKANLIKLINLYEGPVNDCGNYHTAFSNNWLNNKLKSELKKIKIATSNLIRRNFKSSSSETGFTTFKKFKPKLSGNGYTKGFIPVNERATNKYSHLNTMLYLANRFLNPEQIAFFRSKKVKVDEDKWALSELVQWVFRGCIREGKPMNLYIPSKRMRDLFKDWLNEN